MNPGAANDPVTRRAVFSPSILAVENGPLYRTGTNRQQFGSCPFCHRAVLNREKNLSPFVNPYPRWIPLPHHSPKCLPAPRRRNWSALSRTHAAKPKLSDSGVIHRVLDPACTVPFFRTYTHALVPSIFSVTTQSRNRRGIFGHGMKSSSLMASVFIHAKQLSLFVC